MTVYEKNAKIGGLLRYGIPDFKMEKSVIDRRMSQMQAEGVEFRVNSNIGVDIPVERLADEYDAVVLAGGCEQPRDLPVPGRELDGRALRDGVPDPAEPQGRGRAAEG